MDRFGGVERARRLTDRFRRAPHFLVKTELQSILNVLHSNEVTRALLESLLEREKANLGAYAGVFTQGEPSGDVLHLSFATTPESRAAFGYQVAKGLSGNPSAQLVANRIVKIGGFFSNSNKAQLEVSENISRFVEVFIEPIIDFLESAQIIDDLMFATMVRYKQRSEWFETEHLLKVALNSEAASSEEANSFGGQVEKRLKQDFFRYLFDQGIDFTIETQSPKETGQADVLSAKLPDGRRLVLEAKVYRGNKEWVKNGISQAASYAMEWAEPSAYLLIYNLTENSVLEFPGARQVESVWVTSLLSREVRIIDVNLLNTLRASDAHNLNRVPIDAA